MLAKGYDPPPIVYRRGEDWGGGSLHLASEENNMWISKNMLLSKDTDYYKISTTLKKQILPENHGIYAYTNKNVINFHQTTSSR